MSCNIYFYRCKDLFPVLKAPKSKSLRIQFNAVIQKDVWEWEDEKSSIYMRFAHKELGGWEFDIGPFKLHRLV